MASGTRQLARLCIFSGVLTGFNIESYQLLQPEATESTVSVIRELMDQLHVYALDNRTVIAARNPRSFREDTASAFKPPSFVVWVNCLWFASLIISLTAASVALLVKQWIYESNVGISGQSRASTQLLQYRMDLLERWKVRKITMLVPVLLQLALIIFLVGLIILLWNLHTVVAAVCSAFVGVLFFSLATVTLLPAYRWDCCYKSPQTLLVYTVIRAVRNCVTDNLRRCVKICSAHTSSQFAVVRSFSSILQKVCGMLSRAPKFPTWEAQERWDLRKQSGLLDVETAVTAYFTTLDPVCLDRMRIALCGEPDAPLVRCIHALDVGIGDGPIASAALLKETVRGRLSQMALTALRQILTVDRKSRGANSSWESEVQYLLNLYNALSAGQIPHDDVTLKTAFFVSMEANSTENRFAALRCLSTAVNVDSGVACDYLMVSNVLSAAEQWIQKRLPDTALPCFSKDPQSNLFVFYIVVHCMLRVMTRKTTVPSPQQQRFERLCERTGAALSSLPASCLREMRFSRAPAGTSRCATSSRSGFSSSWGLSPTCHP
ncbi:hypothetical protein BD414DRAFT_210689 [Trametes punicea]|nr:hypothetical protein BD414DRAFT_210689 [Trametes punicea]